MEPFIILAVAAVIVVILAVVWQQRTRRESDRTVGQITNTARQPSRPAPTENEPLS